jgi:hypothetical protein
MMLFSSRGMDLIMQEGMREILACWERGVALHAISIFWHKNASLVI